MAAPKYKQIYESLLGRIESGEFQKGDRLPSEMELAQLFSVSRPTVTRALNELRNAGMLRRRGGSGSFVDSLSRDIESSTEQHKRFGILVPRLGEIFEPIANRIAELAHDLDFSLLWLGSTVHDAASPEMYRQTCNRYIEQQVDGIFLVTMELNPEAEQVNREIEEKLLQSKTPVVLIDSDFGVFPERSEFDLVGIDNFRSGYLAAHHFVSQGAKRVDFFRLPYSAPTVEMRIRGFQEAMRDLALPPKLSWVHHGDPADEELVQACLDTGATNIICGNDVTAAELMHTITTLGYQIPKDVRILGFDDMKYARLARVPLTTFRQPCRDLGELAVDAMYSRLRRPTMNPRTVYVEPELVVRSSSRLPSVGQ